jgi:hypothetical protein
MKMIKVFIVGPYDDDATIKVRQQRTLDMLDVCHDLLDYGFAPYCPLWTHYAQEYRSRSRDSWLALAVEYLTVCDCVYMMPQCTERPESAAFAEADRAKALGKPVFYDVDVMRQAYIIKGD